MEVKCKVCGTINDSSNPFCSGCFLPLHKTMEEWTNDIDDKINEQLEVKLEEKQPVEVTPFEELSDEVMEPELETDENPVEEITEEVENVEVPTEEKLEIDDSLEETIDELEPMEEVNSIENEEKIEEEPIITPYEEPKNIENTMAMTTPVTENKAVEEYKDDLRAVSIVKEDNVEKDDFVSEKGPTSYILKFDFILFLLSVAFTLIYGTEINDTSNILFGALSTILFSAVALFATFRKAKPMEDTTNKILLSIFITVILFEIVFRSILIYNSSIYYLYIYVFIALLYILVSIMIVNAISRSIRKNKNELEPSKFVSKLNIITLVIIVILAVVGYVSKDKEILINGNEQITVDQTKEVPQELYTYIDMLNQTIVSNIQNDENYEIPEAVTDATFGNPEIELQEVNLKIDEYGTVSSGTIKYNDSKYIYESGVILVQD